jgi:16S rRNA (uracil1498-N3)-methyltransferase
MRLTRCFLPGPLHAHSVVTLPEDSAVHIRRVLRLRAGAELTVFDGRGGEYAALLLPGAREGLKAEVGEHRAIEREAPVAVSLLQCLARGERMDWIVQKATELGVMQIAPVASRHSVVQLSGPAAERRVAHLRAVTIGACEQCGRNRLPTLAPLRALPAACEAAQEALRLILSPAAGQSLPELLARLPASDPSIALLVGPEGGLSEDEEQLARRHGFEPCRLGPRTLRTETAPLAVLAAIQTLAGDFR